MKNGNKFKPLRTNEILLIVERAMTAANMTEDQQIRELPKAISKIQNKFKRSCELLDQAKRLLEHSDPPKGGYTKQVIGQLRRFLNHNL